MPLKITKSDDVIKVERLNVCIYAQPGVGKTTLAFTAAAPLVLDFDKGAYRAGNRKDIVQVNSWADISGISATDLEAYQTIVMDTAGRALDVLSLDIINKNPKMGKGGGGLTLPGFGELKSRFASFLKLLNSFGKDVVLICHMDEQRNGDDVIERLDAQGSSKGEIYKSVDAMGRIFVRNGKRYLDFSPREGSFGKNPGQLAELEIPPPSKSPHFMAEIIQQIKDKLNAMSADQMKAQTEAEEWATAIRDLSTAEEVNRLIPQLKKAPKGTLDILNKRADELGLIFVKGKGIFTVRETVNA
jgi:hypothetical protein